MSIEPPGVLYVVATPIGNRDDITLRALKVLRDVALVAAEDTRHTGRLLAHHGIRTPLLSLHEHNESQRLDMMRSRLTSGTSVALVSDAGTPLISDPGFQLVRAARDWGVAVVPVPGPSAVVAALSVSGLPVDRFVFEGFPPPRRAARQRHLATLAQEPRTLVFYESSHRIAASLADMTGAFGEQRDAVIARELTKRFETVCTGTLAELSAWLADEAGQRRGEFVVMVAGAANPPAAAVAGLEPQRVLDTLLAELPPRRAAAVAARLTGESPNRLYRRAVAWRGGSGDGDH